MELSVGPEAQRVHRKRGWTSGGRSAGLLWSMLALLAAAGCSTPDTRAVRIARNGMLQSAIIDGSGFTHQIFYSAQDASGPLIVFLDGDGVPWVHHGSAVASDPTSRKPLALMLAAETPAPSLYLGRPCYFAAARADFCPPALWTSARYSSRVVASLCTAINRFATDHGYRTIVLVGFSGGGSLAVLIAPHVERVRAVVTIAGNLDVDAWTALHGYLPLTESLNPAREPPLAATISQWHVVGGKDSNVPSASNDNYWRRIDPARIWLYPAADHTCCWVAQWPAIYARLRESLLREQGIEPAGLIR